MSRIGKRPVPLPTGVSATFDGGVVSVEGPKGRLVMPLPDHVSVDVEKGSVSISPKVPRSRESRSTWGLARSLVSNMVVGVSSGYERKLILQGVGYRARMKSVGVLNLALGFSHDIEFPVREGVTIVCPSQTEIVISGLDKRTVGQVASDIRSLRPPEPYKAKGVRYEGEYVFRKEGKKK